MKRRRRHLLAGLAVVALVATTGAAGIHLTGAEVPATAAVGDGEMPGATGAHLERLWQTTPGNDGMSPEGPGGAAQQEFLERAYPANAITIAQFDRSKAAYSAADKRSRGSQRWTNVGPSEALYPFTRFRDAYNYVPNEYVAGGRVTSLDISPDCNQLLCRAYATPAGGGVWGTLNILAAQPKWFYLGGPLGINAAGSVKIDRNDRTGLTIYVGTGEANTCASGCVAGVGLYRSTNGGLTWQGPLGKDVLAGKGIGEITIKPGDPKTLYVATTTALRGMSSSCCTGVTRPVPDAAKWGLYKSTDGGANWKFIHNGAANATECTGSLAEYNNTAACSPRGVRYVKLDPRNANVVYASSYARGVWRSADAGATWTQIKPSLNATLPQTRAAIDVTALPGGTTRMYVYEGNTGTPYSRLFRSDDVAGGTPTFTDLTSANPADPGYATYNQCTGQCWYDVFVHTPAGHPDLVYTGGSYVYGETIAHKRAVVLSTDAGVSGTDMTYDGTDELHPNGLHPDQHALITNPRNPYQFFEANDGGLMRSSGQFVDRSAWCDNPDRGLTTQAQKDRCRQMLSKIPSKLEGINTGMNTLQFISLSVSPHDHNLLQGGTQDNGTWENKGQRTRWVNTMIGDGGASGFDVAKPEFRFHTFYDVTPEVNFNNGDIGSWISVYDGVFGQAGNLFYAPVITDPKVSGTMFAGTGRSVYRTKTFGLGNRTLEEANRICNSWTGTFEAQCGDWEQLGTVALTDAAWGDRAGGAVSVVQRVGSDSSTAYAATSTGRVFVTRNADATPASAVTWTRIDTAATPNRFVTSVHIDPADPARAWISYSGFNSNTPATLGHAFEVRVTGAGASWSDRSYDFGDQPITDLVRDDATGDLYAATDFGVLRLARGTTSWVRAGAGMPNVEVAGLTIVPGKRILYAASHGLGAWQLALKK
ncbi:sialidase family protein [Micromonospora sp. WMMD812]|uniref:sialidase family protein n=1 Tax=Micromonospora sp. WMMD812 TaxID=3015152 RepID=UPI00248ACCC5|nr:sialidase family protein [Micromonospora sp. WMMD812]WBB68601.1 sialidase family protein [Micromonospora sp. WMMD812]